jgi:monoamine oxidase
MVLDVAIVGAGAAGVACAQKLSEEKKKIVVFEARSRIGGRVFTHPLHETLFPIELGAE